METPSKSGLPIDQLRDWEPHEWEDKNWGRVSHLFYNADVGMSLLEVVPGQRCSLHYHEHRVNHFHSITATLLIEMHSPVYAGNDNPWRDSPDSIQLVRPGESFTVDTDIWHLFKVLEPGRVVELYYCNDAHPVDPNDIIRWDVGKAFE